MRRRTFLKTGGAFLLAGCGTKAPAAETPTLKSISSVAPRTCAWTPFVPDAAGNVALLPSGHPSGDIRVVFQAPYPSKIAVDIGGQIVLREADNTQGPGEGSYKINSTTLVGGAFEWDVTFTPPASQRVEPSFRLNVANVSINPGYTGNDKTSPPLSLAFTRPAVPDLDAWFAANPTIRNAIIWERSNGVSGYSSWTAQEKQFLRDTFADAWNTNFLLLGDPPRNKVALADTDDPKTAFEGGDAWPLFVSHVAYSLAVEIGGWTSWSMAAYSTDQLAILLDSREMFRWDAGANGYMIYEGNGFLGVVPASPWTTLLFLHENGIYTCRSRLDVIDRMLDWCRQNLSHFVGKIEAKNMEDQWQYRGCPPAVRVMKGTPFPSSPVPSIAGIMHRTAGCWGTTAFLRAALRVLNIPVKHEDHVGHSMPYFISEGLYLSHGDDPYNRLSHATPPFPARELLIDQTTHDAWFGSGISSTAQLNNVGRRPQELAVKYLSDELLRNRCDDQAAGTSDADSKVFASLKNNFTVTDLEAQNFWGQLDAKISNLGGCTQIP